MRERKTEREKEEKEKEREGERERENSSDQAIIFYHVIQERNERTPLNQSMLMFIT